MKEECLPKDKTQHTYCPNCKMKLSLTEFCEDENVCYSVVQCKTCHYSDEYRESDSLLEIS